MDENSHSTSESLIREILANQQSLHEDMVAVAERLATLENAIVEITTQHDARSTIDDESLYKSARALVVETGKASTSFLQKMLLIGYSRAAFIIDRLEQNGVIGPSQNATPRPVLMSPEELLVIEDEEEYGHIVSVDVDDKDMYEAAKQAVIESGKASTSFLQRKLKIGYSRAARLIDMLEEKGVIGPGEGSGPRIVIKK